MPTSGRFAPSSDVSLGIYMVARGFAVLILAGGFALMNMRRPDSSVSEAICAFAGRGIAKKAAEAIMNTTPARFTVGVRVRSARLGEGIGCTQNPWPRSALDRA